MTAPPMKRPKGATAAKIAALADPSMIHAPAPVRIQEALAKIADGWSKSAAADFCGLNIRTLSRHVVKARQNDDDIAARSEAARLARLTPEQRMAVEAERRQAAAIAERKAAGRIDVTARPLDDQRKRVPHDVVEFYDRYFGGIKCRQHLVHHELPQFHIEMMRKIVDPATKRLIINVPYGHSKSTNGTLVTSLHGIAHDPNIQIGILSATTRLAERFVLQIRNFLTDPRMYEGSPGDLIAEAGPFVDGVGRLGNNQEFRVNSRESIDKDPTVAAYGYGQEIQSTRLDRLVGDDLATRKNHRTPDRIVQMADDVTQDYVSRLDENGQLILIGTRVKPGDLYSHLEELPAFEIIRYPCVLDYEQGRTLWPEHFSYEAAMRQKGSMSAERWELVYQNSTYFADGGTFSQQHLEACHDPTRVLGQEPSDPVTCFIGVDPAGDGPQAGYTALVLVGVNRATGMRYLIDLANHKSMKASQMKSQILDWCTRYRVHIVAIENKGVQRQIFDDPALRKALTETGARLDATSHRTSDGKGLGGKYDPQWGIDAMSTPFHNGMWSIPWGEGRGSATAAIETRRRVKELEDQLMRFPMEGAPTDLMMALWVAESQVLKWLGGGRRRLYSERERFDELPADVEDRRRVHTRGEVRGANATDFGRGVYTGPRRVVNAGPQTERDILDAM